MRESPADGLPKPAAPKRLKALGAFSAGMLIAFAAALIYVHLQHRGTVQPQNIVRPESQPAQAAEIEPATATQSRAGASAAVASEKQVAAPPAATDEVAAGQDEVGVQSGSANSATDEPPAPGLPNAEQADKPATASAGPVTATAAPPAPASGYPGSAQPESAHAVPKHPVPNNVARTLPEQPARAPQQAIDRRLPNEEGAGAQNPVRTAPKARFVTVQPGTAISVRLAETLSSDRNKTGDQFRGTLSSSLVVNGAVLAQAGSTVLGTVAHARKAPLIRGAAELSLVITNITASDGTMVKVDTDVYEEKGARNGIVNTAKMTTGAAVGAVVGALTGAAEGAGISSGLKRRDRTGGFMATKRVVVLPAGTEETFTVATAVALPEAAESH